jgi:hypothetical protein
MGDYSVHERPIVDRRLARSLGEDDTSGLLDSTYVGLWDVSFGLRIQLIDATD